MRVINLLLTLTSFFLLYNCTNVSAEPSLTETTDSDSTVVTDSNTDPILFAVVDGLTIREVPDVKGGALQAVPYGERVTDLGEESEFKEKITLRGQVHYTTWRKVSYASPDGNTIVGWAYGGGLSSIAPPAEDREAPVKHRISDLEQVSGRQVMEILDIDVPLDYLYDLMLSYTYETSNAPPVLDGNVRVSTTWDIEISRNYTHPASMTVTGRYTKGRKDGTFEFAVNGYENSSTITSFYEKGRCQWFEISIQAEGPPMTLREDNPASCTLNYMRSWAKRNFD